MAGEVKALIEKGKSKIAEKVAQGGPDGIYWNALGDFLDKIDEHADDFQEVGQDGLKQILDLVSSDSDLAAKLAWIEQASVDELIEEMGRVGTRLDAFVARREKLKSLLLAVLKAGGPIAAKLALNLLFPGAGAVLPV